MRTPFDANPLRPRAGLLALALAAPACFSPVGKDGTGTGTDASTSTAASSTSGSNVTSTGETTATTTTPTTDPNPGTTAITTTVGPGPTTDETTTTSTTDLTLGDTGTTAITDPMTTTGSSSTTETDKLCGNGVLDPMEMCDDGPLNANDAPCTELCQINICGDDLTCVACPQPEQCDDGNTDNDDGCSDQCLFEVRYVFVTKASYAGQELGGVVAADAKCNQAASQAAQLSPLLQGRTFRAWLSNSVLDAKMRIGVDSRPVLRTDLMKVTESTPGLYAGKLLLPIDRNEFGEQVAAPKNCLSKLNLVWTGTLGDGTRAVEHCANWSGGGGTGVMGNFSSIDLTWTNCDDFPCMGQGHLYCIEVPDP